MSDAPVVQLNAVDRSIAFGTQRADLTVAEFTVVSTLAGKPGQLVSREALNEALYGQAPAGFKSNVLEVLIHRIRRKAERIGAPRLIKTSRSQGYTFLVEVRHAAAA